MEGGGEGGEGGVVYGIVGDSWEGVGGSGAGEDCYGVFAGCDGGAEDFGGDVWGGVVRMIRRRLGACDGRGWGEAREKGMSTVMNICKEKGRVLLRNVLPIPLATAILTILMSNFSSNNNVRMVNFRILLLFKLLAFTDEMLLV